MESAPVIIFVGALVFLAHLFVALFERTRIPEVLYLVLLVDRPASVRLFTDRFTTTKEDARLTGVMIPRGTAAVAPSGIPLQMGIAGGGIVQNGIYAVTIVSILVTAIFIFLLERTAIANVLNLIFRGCRRSGASTPDMPLTGEEGSSKRTS